MTWCIVQHPFVMLRENVQIDIQPIFKFNLCSILAKIALKSNSCVFFGSLAKPCVEKLV